MCPYETFKTAYRLIGLGPALRVLVVKHQAAPRHRRPWRRHYAVNHINMHAVGWFAMHA